MVNEDSSIKHFYPMTFETDLNGKQQEWEAVVLIPFIDEKDLVAAMEPCTAKLQQEVKGRLGKKQEIAVTRVIPGGQR